MENAKYRIGDVVEYRGSWGKDPVEVVTIIGMDDEEKDELVYDLSNERWCYEDQIDGLVA